MKTLGIATRAIISLLIVAAGLIGFFWLGTSDVPTRPPSRGASPLVKTVVANDHAKGIDFEVDGVVVPFRQIEIAAQVSGRIEFKADNCRTGRAVKAGDLLIRVEPNDYELEVTRLQEEQKQAEAMIRELQVEIETTQNQIKLMQEQLVIDQRQLERNQLLSTTAAASQTELDTAMRTELSTRNSLQSLIDNKSLLNQRLVRMESGEALVKANLEKAKLSLERTEIRAPLDGIIVSENVEQDGYIQAGNTMITLQDTSQLDVTCKLHMRQMDWLWQSKSSAEGNARQTVAVADDEELAEGAVLAGAEAYDFPETPATITYQLGRASYRWHGVLDRYDGAGIDDRTRMVPCRVHVDDPLAVEASTGSESATGLGAKPPSLMTGMFVKVEITATPPIPLVRVPQESLQPGNMVWTVVNGKLLRKEARVATSIEDPESGDKFIVAYQQPGGLQAGDIVVVSPLPTPVDGLPVREDAAK